MNGHTCEECPHWDCVTQLCTLTGDIESANSTVCEDSPLWHDDEEAE